MDNLNFLIEKCRDFDTVNAAIVDPRSAVALKLVCQIQKLQSM